MDGTGDTVLKLEVHLRDGIFGEDGGIGDVTWSMNEYDTAGAGTVLGCVGGSYVRIAADSTMFLIVNLLIALSLGVHLEQLEQRMGLTWPLPFLFRPLWYGQHDTYFIDDERT